IISKGIDENKDQSYALWGISQKSLSRTIFPLGHLRKTEIREFAGQKGFVDLINKPESYEICFVPDNDYRGFLKRRVEGLEEKVKGGEFVLEDGTVVGHHEGYPFYTIGQRKGLGIALGYPIFVSEIQKDTNRVVLATMNELFRDGLWAGKLTMGKYESIEKPLETVTKVRYNDPGTPAVIQQEGDKMKVHFHRGVSAIAPGQAAVFYEGNDVVGGGWISSSFRQEL
ncbi:MAG: tRNA methyl transferase PRC-barrel domain-containing protein, partial [Cytophagaceae bacterium]